jgi:hypothetical protein
VQAARANAYSLAGLENMLALGEQEHGLYRAMRENVPVIDAALDKIVRLTGGFTVCCTDMRRQELLDDFVKNVRVGASRQGLRQFVTTYLDCLLTYGNAVGEMVLDEFGEIYGLYNAALRDLAIRQGESPMDAQICVNDGLAYKPVEYPQLVLYTALNPPPGEVRGVSLLRSLPFVSDVLMKIFQSTSVNFERIANLRYAVTYRSGGSGLDRAHAQEIAQSIAAEWGEAMSSAKSGAVKDFVAVGDVDIKVIGADNQMLDIAVPARQMMEQIVAKLGIPPFMLGLHWSTTERMSTQQADILTSELESYRSLLDSVICKICETFLRLRGFGGKVQVHWDDINLQDQVEQANARLLNAQARELEGYLEGGESDKIGECGKRGNGAQGLYGADGEN